MNIYDALILKAVGGGGGTTVVANPEGEATDELEKLQVGNDIYEIPKDYEDLDNKPQINSVELDGNKTASDLGLQTELKGAQTVSGNPITITDAEPMNAESVKVELEPKQDLHGYDAPWVGGAGKNKCPAYTSTDTQHSVTIEGNSKGEISVNGTLDGVSLYAFILSDSLRLEAGTYALNGTNNPNGARLVLYDKRDGNILADTYDAVTTFTLESATIARLGLFVYENVQYDEIVRPMIRLATESDPTFAPYSNICPISGYSEVNVERVGKNRLDSNYYSGSHASQSNVDIVKNDDGSLNVTINGSCEGTVNYLFKNTDTSSGLKSGNYKATIKAEGSYTGNINLVLGGASSTLPYSDIAMNDVASLTVPSDDATIGYCLLQIPTGATVTGTLKLYPMIADEDANVTVFEPYQGSTATISLGGTKYGGTLDVTEGGYSDEWGYISGSSVSDLVSAGMYDITTIGGLYALTLSDIAIPQDSEEAATIDKLVCNNLENISATQSWNTNTSGVSISSSGSVIFVVKDITTQADMDTWLSNNPIQIAYRKKTPSSVSTTPTDIPLLENTNNISTDGTNIQLKYQPNNVIGECKVYTDEKCSEVLPPLPTTDGTYHLSCEVTSGVSVLSWVSDS